MKKLAKYIGLLVLFFIILFFVVPHGDESKFQCSGEISDKGTTQPLTVFIKMEDYRWWVGLWSNSKGNVKLEIPNVHVTNYFYIDKVGDERHIFRWKGEVIAGRFSTLSRAFMINIDPYGFFEGVCSPID